MKQNKGQSSKESKSGKESRWEELGEKIRAILYREGVHIESSHKVIQTVCEAVLERILTLRVFKLNIVGNDKLINTIKCYLEDDIRKLLTGEGER